MATITSAPRTVTTEARPADSGIFHEIRMFWRLFFVAAFDPYRPEQHYMRGPGPACRAKIPTKPASPSH
jgi:hypothetical protein